MSSSRRILIAGFVALALLVLAGLGLSAAAQPLAVARPAVAPPESLVRATTQLTPVAYLPFVIKVPVPDAPTLNPINNPTNSSSYQVTWSGDAVATVYTLQEMPPGYSFTTVYVGPATSWSTSSRPNGTYSYRVKAANQSGESGWSAVQLTTVAVPPPAPVLNPINNPANSSSYQVTWSAAARATSYTLEEDTVPQFAHPDTVYYGTGTVWNASGKAAGTYYYRVAAGNAAGNGPWSATRSTTVFPPGISGRITYQGSGVAGLHLDLRFFNGSTWSTAAGATTDSVGGYTFMPGSLSAGQVYYVRYWNNSSGGNVANPAYFSQGWSRNITSFTAGGSVALGDLDIANIVLSSPGHGATVGLPATFSWQVRPASPTDSYVWELFSLSSNAFWDSPYLGYTGSYTLSSLPGGFASNTPYGWAVWEDDPQGDGGASYYYRGVTFSSGLLVPAPDGTPAGLLGPRLMDRVEAAKAAQR